MNLVHFYLKRTWPPWRRVMCNIYIWRCILVWRGWYFIDLYLCGEGEIFYWSILVWRGWYFIDLTALKLQVQLIHGITSVPRILGDILIFLCSFLFPACDLGDRSNPIKPVTYTLPQPHSLVLPNFFISRGKEAFSEERITALSVRSPN